MPEETTDMGEQPTPDPQPEATGAEAETTETEAVGDDSPQFTVTVDGEEQNVSLAELQGGYMRQADYTRKTQAVAEQQSRLETLDRFETALERDPEQTLKNLAAQYNLDLYEEGSGEPTPNSDVEWADAPEGFKKEFEELKSWKAELEKQRLSEAEAQQMAQIDADLERIKSNHNEPDLPEDQLLQFAVERSIGDLEAAYLLWRKENPLPKPNAPVEGGHNRSAPEPGSSSKPTLAEAVRLAEAQVGSSF